jgi:hypothetical protein
VFEKTIKQILNNPRLRPSDGYNLLGMDYDISHAFDSSDIFNVLEIKQTGAKESMFDIRLTISKSVDVCKQVILGLQEAWDFIAYGCFEDLLYTIDNNLYKTDSNNAIFKFLTVNDIGQYYVTRKITISGSVRINGG